jgi:hemoglobin-like flavoprotein
MSPESQRLIRESWAALQPIGDQVVATFYERLFASSPEVAKLFHAEKMAEQRRKFAAMLSEIVRVLDRPELLVSEVAESGRRHVNYGVRERDYDDVGAALIWTLEHELKSEFTPELKAAWREAYTLLAAVMRRAAEAMQSPR